METLSPEVKLLRHASAMFSLLAADERVQGSMIQALQLLVQLLGVAKSDDITLKNVNTALFAMASNDSMLSRILQHIEKQKDASLTTKRWVTSMLAMLSSESEWLDQVFMSDESAHPAAQNTGYTREISVPLASKLIITWDKRTSMEKGKDFVTIAWKQSKRKLSGAFADMETLEIDGSSVSVRFSVLLAPRRLSGDIGCL